MARAGDLLRDLREDGRMDSTGRFTLDAARAREKMQKYQLTDPHLYVLQVVQSAVAGGASFVDVRCDANDCWLRYDGRVLEAGDLETLFSSLFQSDKDESRLPLRELAIGLNAALALNPLWILVESWDGTRGCALRLAAALEKVEPLSACPWPEGTPGTAIHVKQRVSWQVLARFVTGLVSLPPEGRALRESCAWCPVPVRFNGADVRPRPPGPGRELARHRVEEPGLQAEIVLPADLLPVSDLQVVLNGVSVTRRGEKLEGAAEVQAVVWARGLAKNVSQSDVVEDAAWRGVLVGLRSGVRAMLLELARSYADHPRRAELTPVLYHAIRRQGLRAEAGWERWKELKQALLDVPCLQRHDGQPLALRPLFEQYDRLGYLPLCQAPFPEDLPGIPLVALQTADSEPVLRAVFKSRRDVDEDLVAARRWQKLYEQWRASPPGEPRLATGSFLVRVPLDPPLQGEAALPDAPLGEKSHLVLFKQGRAMLETVMRPAGDGERAALWPGVWAAVDHDGLEPDREWKEPLENAALEEVRRGVEASLPRLFAALARARLDPVQQVRAAEAAAACVRFLAASGASWAGPGSPLPEGVAEVPAFRTLAGVRVSLRDLAEELAARGDLAWVEAGTKLPPDPGLDRLVLHPAPGELPAVEAFFGQLRLVDVGRLLERSLRKARFLEQPVQEPVVQGPVLAAVDFAARDGLRGQVAVPAHTVGLNERGLHLQVLHQGRPLARRVVEDAPGTLKAVVDAPEVTPDEHWTDLVEDDAWRRLLGLVMGAVRRIPQTLAARLSELPAAQREAALDVLWRQLSWEAGPACDGFFEKLDPLRREMMQLPVFPTVDGRWCSLRDVLDAAHAQGKVGYLAEAPPAPLREGELVLRVPPARASLLRGIVGTYRLADATADFRARAQERILEEAAPVDSLALGSGPHLAVTRLEGRVEGVLGLLPDPTAQSSLAMHRQRRFLSVLHVRMPVAVEASLNCDELQPGPEGVARGDALDGVLDLVGQKARQLAAKTVLEAPPERLEDSGFRRWTIGLAAWLQREGYKRAPDALDRALLAVPLFPTADGGRVGLGALSEAFAARGTLGYLSLKHGLPEDLVRAAPAPCPLLSAEDRERLSKIVYPMEDLAPGLERQARALQNRSRERLADRRLEALFPEERWLARLAVEESGLTGELGLPARRPEEPGVVLCVEGLPMAREDLHPGPGFLGVVDGPFQVTETWDGLADRRAPRRLLDSAHRRLMGELLRVFPDRSSPDFPRARQAVLAWTDWRAALDVPLAGLERALAELPLFLLAGGRHADLATAGEHAQRYRRLLRCLPGQSPPAAEEVVFEIEPGSEEERFLAALSPRGLLDWEVALVIDVPSSPEPAEPALEERGDEAPPEAPPPEAPPAEEPAVEAPPSPEEALLAALRGELRLIRESGHPELSEDILDEIRLGKTPKGALWSCGKGGRHPVLNGSHPAVRRLLAAREIRPAELYFLLSSLYSVLNRACPEIEDRHEREFHRRVLGTLLGPGPG